ncbi:MAG: allantoinase AllB [Planctomycetota bacterium]
MPIDLLIRGGHVVTPDGVRECDIAVDAGTIVSFDAEPAREEVDATGLHVFPGLVDPHVHFNEPGRAEWEGLATGSAALAAGGGTVFFDMPLNSTPVTNADAFDAKAALAAAKSVADFGLWGGLTPDSLDHMPALADRGVVGFKAFMCATGIDDFQHADPDTLMAGMEIAGELGLPVAVHAEDPHGLRPLAADADWDAFTESRPIRAEASAIIKAIALSQDAGCDLHVVHLSSMRCISGGMEQLASFETCPHYLTFTDADMREHGSSLKCAPPLRRAGDIDGLWDELWRDKVIEFVASDHSPCPPQLKEGGPAKAWGGIAGVQSTRSVLLERLQPKRVAQLTAERAVQRFGLENKGRISVGFDADLALVDVSCRYELTTGMLLDRHKLSPYVGRTMTGLTRRTILRGTTTFLDGRIVAEPCGRLLTPRRSS